MLQLEGGRRLESASTNDHDSFSLHHLPLLSAPPKFWSCEGQELGTLSSRFPNPIRVVCRTDFASSPLLVFRYQ